jgi:hypothetical protein
MKLLLLTIALLVALYSYSSNANTINKLTGLTIPTGFDTSNYTAFKGYDANQFDGKPLNPFDYDINDVMTRFAVSFRITIIF